MSNIETDNSQNVGLEDYNISRVFNIESDNSQNVGLEDYNIISDGFFPHFTTRSIKIGLGLTLVKTICIVLVSNYFFFGLFYFFLESFLGVHYG